MSRTLLVVALLASVACTAFAGKCKQKTFCERWMCEQNANRRERIEKWLGASYNLAQLDVCNAQQSGAANLMVETCTIPGANPPTLDVGMRYDLSTCAEEKPPQLNVIDSTGNKLEVKAESNALITTNQSKNAEATRLYDQQKPLCGTAGFQPIHPCICKTVAKNTCLTRVRQDVFFNKTAPYFNQAYLDRFTGEFVEENSIELANLGVTAVPGARPTAEETCIRRFGEAACQAVSPAAVRRTRRSLRAVVSA